MQNAILTVYREPFGIKPHIRRFPEGMTLFEMRLGCDFLPDNFDDGGIICINGEPVPQAAWPLLRPKLAVSEITFHAPIQGGGNGGGEKNILATVAGIGLSMLTGGIASGAILGGLTGAAVAGAPTIASVALAAGVSYLGSLLISSLIPPPAEEPKPLEGSSIQGNLLARNAPIPRVVGTAKVYPPMATEPFIYYAGADEVVEAVYVLDGPHDLDDIRLDNVAVSSAPYISLETKEGWDSDTPITLVTRYAKTEQVNKELRGATTEDGDGVVVDQNASYPLPLPQVFFTHLDADSHQLQLFYPQGLGKGDLSTHVNMPFRIRLRRAGTSTWYNLPEVHFGSRRRLQKRVTIEFVFGAYSGPPLVDYEATDGWRYKINSVPNQAVSPVGGAWSAHSTFVSGNSTVVRGGNTLQVELDPDIFGSGRFEIEITRGSVYTNSSFNPATYTLGGTVYNLFGYSVNGSDWELPEDQGEFQTTTYIVRSCSVFEKHPLPEVGMATIALRTTNRQVGRLSVVASGYVKDWDGSAWENWVITSNPAPHLRDVLIGTLNKDPLPEPILNNADFLEWRTHCDNMGYSVNAVIEDKSIDEAARTIAGCGYATLYMSEIWSVVMDRDRSADLPTQVFTNRNMKGFRFTRAFARVPDGLLVNYINKEIGFEEDQLQVDNPYAYPVTRLEQVVYEGLVTDLEIERRALYDMAQAKYRSIFYSFEASSEHLVCRKGDLIAVQRDILNQHQASARIVSWVETTAGVTHITVDQPVSTGGGNAVLLVSSDGSSVVGYSTADGMTLTLASPVDPDYVFDGGLVITGPSTEDYRRMIVFEILPKTGYTATITVVDEAPEIWSEISISPDPALYWVDSSTAG